MAYINTPPAKGNPQENLFSRTRWFSADDIGRGLGGVRSRNGWKCRCPAHDDAHASLSVSEGYPDRTKTAVKCHAGCSQQAVIDALRHKGLWGDSDGSKPRAQKPNGGASSNKPTGDLVESYSYKSRDGKHLYYIDRYELPTIGSASREKDFLRRPAGGVNVVYRWPELVAAGPDATLFATEGEKDANRLAKLGLVATTVAHGSWKGVDVSDIKGRDVIILEDADKPGVVKARKSAEALSGIAKAIRIVRLPGQEHTAEKHGKDVSDWLDEGHTVDELIEACFAAPLWEPGSTDDAAEPDQTVFTPQPYTCKDPATLPRRDWLYGRYLCRKYVSIDVAPGGLGKSAHSLVEMGAMVSHTALLGIPPRDRLKVWYWNLEDPADEIDKRVEAVRLHYDLKPEDIDGRLFVNHGRETPLVIGVEERDGVKIFKPTVDALIAAIQREQIDVVIVDPFVSTHRVNENDNMAVDAITKEWSRIADVGNCAVRLVHHTRKGEVEVTSESGRGASAMNFAGRIVRVFNRMSRDEAEHANVDGELRRRYYRTYVDKGNLAPPSESSEWFYLESVDLGNGESFGGDFYERSDSMGVATQWQWPENVAPPVTDDELKACLANLEPAKYRADVKSPDWVGHMVGRVIGLDTSKKGHRLKIIAILKEWVGPGKPMREVPHQDAHRKTKIFVEAAT